VLYGLLRPKLADLLKVILVGHKFICSVRSSGVVAGTVWQNGGYFAMTLSYC